MTREERAAQVKAARKEKSRRDRKAGRGKKSSREKKATGSAGFRFLNKLTKTQRLVAAVTAVFVAFSVVTYGISYYRVKQEQKELLAHNKELKQQKKELEDELKVSDTKEYIEEQARKSLRLMNKDEKLFYFEEDEEDE